MEMYSTHDEEKSVIGEIFIRALKNKIYEYITSIFIDTLDHIVNKYNNTYHRTIKMKPVDVKSNTYIEKINNKNPKFKIGDNVRISKCKSVSAKDYTPNWSEEVFAIKRVTNTAPWTYVINDLIEEEIVGTFSKKELEKANKKEHRIEKQSREKVINDVLNEKNTMIPLIAR